MARKLIDEGSNSISEACKNIGISRASLYRYLKEHGLLGFIHLPWTPWDTFLAVNGRHFLAKRYHFAAKCGIEAGRSRDFCY